MNDIFGKKQKIVRVKVAKSIKPLSVWKALGFDSNEELSFDKLLTYMKGLGVVDSWICHPEPWLLSPKQAGLNKHIYTCDFIVTFTQNIGYGAGEVAIEIKPTFDMHNMTRLVKTNIKWLYDKYKVRVHILEIKPLLKNQSLESYYNQIFFTPKVRKKKK